MKNDEEKILGDVDVGEEILRLYDEETSHVAGPAEEHGNVAAESIQQKWRDKKTQHFIPSLVFRKRKKKREEATGSEEVTDDEDVNETEVIENSGKGENEEQSATESGGIASDEENRSNDVYIATNDGKLEGADNSQHSHRSPLVEDIQDAPELNRSGILRVLRRRRGKPKIEHDAKNIDLNVLKKDFENILFDVNSGVGILRDNLNTWYLTREAAVYTILVGLFIFYVMYDDTCGRATNPFLVGQGVKYNVGMMRLGVNKTFYDFSSGTCTRNQCPAQASEFAKTSTVAGDFSTVQSKKDYADWVLNIFQASPLLNTGVDLSGNNRKIGMLRIRVLRSKNVCDIDDGGILETPSASCSGSWTPENNDESGFVGKNTGKRYEYDDGTAISIKLDDSGNPAALSKRVQSIDDAMVCSNKFSENSCYPASGGYTQYIPSGNITDMVSTWNALIDDGWIEDASIRFAAMDFAVYNTALNIYTSVEYAAEFSATGACKAVATVQPYCFRGDEWTHSKESATLVLGYILFGLSLMGLLWYVRDIHFRARNSERISDVMSASSFFDIVNLCFVIAGLVMQYTLSSGLVCLEGFFDDSTHMVNLLKPNSRDYSSCIRLVSSLSVKLKTMNGITVVMLTLKYMKYFSVVSRYGIGCQMLQANRKILFSIFVIGFICLVAFALPVHFILGPASFAFSDIGHAIITLILYLCRDWGDGYVQDSKISDNKISYPVISLLFPGLSTENSNVASLLFKPLLEGNVEPVLSFWVLCFSFFMFWGLIYAVKAIIVVGYVDTRRAFEDRSALRSSHFVNTLGPTLSWRQTIQSYSQVGFIRKIMIRLETDPEATQELFLTVEDLYKLVAEECNLNDTNKALFATLTLMRLCGIVVEHPSVILKLSLDPDINPSSSLKDWILPHLFLKEEVSATTLMEAARSFEGNACIPNEMDSILVNQKEENYDLQLFEQYSTIDNLVTSGNLFVFYSIIALQMLNKSAQKLEMQIAKLQSSQYKLLGHIARICETAGSRIENSGPDNPWKAFKDHGVVCLSEGRFDVHYSTIKDEFLQGVQDIRVKHGHFFVGSFSSQAEAEAAFAAFKKKQRNRALRSTEL